MIRAALCLFFLALAASTALGKVCRCSADWNKCLKKTRMQEFAPFPKCVKKCLEEHNSPTTKCLNNLIKQEIKAEGQQDMCFLREMSGKIGCSKNGQKGLSYEKQYEQWEGAEGSEMPGSYSDEEPELTDEQWSQLDKLYEKFDKQLRTVLSGTKAPAFGDCVDNCWLDFEGHENVEQKDEASQSTSGSGSAEYESGEMSIEFDDEAIQKCAADFTCEAAYVDLKALEKAEEKCVKSHPEIESELEEEVIAACKCAGKLSECEKASKEFLSEYNKITGANVSTPSLVSRRRRRSIMVRRR